MNEIYYAISQVGFPIFITCYLVVRQDKLLLSIIKELKNLNGKDKEK